MSSALNTLQIRLRDMDIVKLNAGLLVLFWVWVIALYLGVAIAPMWTLRITFFLISTAFFFWFVRLIDEVSEDGITGGKITLKTILFLAANLVTLFVNLIIVPY